MDGICQIALLKFKCRLQRARESRVATDAKGIEGGKRGRQILTGKKDVVYSRDFSKVPKANLMKWVELSGFFGISLNKSYKYNPAALSRPSSYSFSAAATSL